MLVRPTELVWCSLTSLHRHSEIPGRGAQQPVHTSLPVGILDQARQFPLTWLISPHTVDYAPYNNRTVARTAISSLSMRAACGSTLLSTPGSGGSPAPCVRRALCAPGSSKCTWTSTLGRSPSVVHIADAGSPTPAIWKDIRSFIIENWHRSKKFLLKKAVIAISWVQTLSYVFLSLSIAC
jgi:hypothetical protein